MNRELHLKAPCRGSAKIFHSQEDVLLNLSCPDSWASATKTMKASQCISLPSQERTSVKLEVALLLNVAMEGVNVNAVHHGAAFVLDLVGVRTSLALDSSAKDVR